MKKILLGIVTFAVVAVGGAVAYWTLFLPKQQPPPDINVALTPTQIERGRYLVVNVLQCVDCHSERDWTLYGGPPVEPIGAGRACFDGSTRAAGVNVGQEFFPGRLCIRNITPHRETGIGNWTDGEIIRAVREGVGNTGEGLFPIMPYFIYKNVADSDMEAVVAYLRTMPAVESVRPERELDFAMQTLVQMWPEPLSGPVAKPDTSDRLAYGEYLATIARCEFCHTPRDSNSMEGFEGRRFAGGMPFFLNGRTMYTMNLTPHATGLGSWSKAQFIQRFKENAVPHDVAEDQNTLMNWSAFAGMTEDDLSMMYEFFMTVPAVPYVQESI